jgi:tRNA dimethylallyltransferase
LDAPALPLVAIAGPTGSGKTALASSLAETFQGEVVNCDSLQVYRHFDIGTAKAPPQQRRNIPHHLIDIVNPDETFTAGQYARMARDTVAAISARRRLPVVAGGTGFYLRALLDGLFAGPTRNEALRQRLAAHESRRPGALHRQLAKFDPAAAQRIHPNDVPKVTRALEVCLTTRQPITELFLKGRDALRGYKTLKIGLQPDRDELYRRLDLRCQAMFEGGLIEETRYILSLGYPAASKPFEAHGYKQALQFLNQELTWKEALNYAQRNTRHYAKRQITWFRREPDLEWLRGFGDSPEIRGEAIERVKEFLANCRE